jgi:hypothetical protein
VKNGDFSEIDTRGGARDFQSRRPTPPRAFSNKETQFGILNFEL